MLSHFQLFALRCDLMLCVIVLVQLAAILCVISYWQDLQDDLYGKERRMKYYSKLANIRNAALSGQNTPYKSYFSSRSQLMLNQSQASFQQPPRM